MNNSARRNYIAAGLAFLCAAAGLIVVRILFQLGIFDNLNEDMADFLGSFMIQVLAILCSALGFYLFFKNSKTESFILPEAEQPKQKPRIIGALEEIGFRMPKPYMWPLSILMGFLFLFVTMGFSVIGVAILGSFGYNFPDLSDTPETATVGLFLLSLFSSAVLPGVCEETLYRGVVLKGLKGVHTDEHSLLLSALFFALGHAFIVQSIYTFAGGVILAILVIKTKSIYPSMIVHFINNGLITYFEYARVGGWPVVDAYDAAMDWLTSNIFIFFTFWLMAAALMGLIIFFIWKSAGKKEQRHNIIRYDEQNRPVVAPQIPAPAIEQKYRPTLLEKIPMYSAVFLVATITIFTFIWGLF